MGIHIDVSREVDGYESKSKMAYELMNLLPDTIMTDDSENRTCCC